MEKQTTVEFLVRFPEVLGKSNTTSSKDILINPINQDKQITPKEKANELVDKFRNEITSFLGDNMKKINAKKCALVAVDELIKIHYLLTTTHDTSPSINYWQEVKQELENL
jgi:hypothetical protein